MHIINLTVPENIEVHLGQLLAAGSQGASSIFIYSEYTSLTPLNLT